MDNSEWMYHPKGGMCRTCRHRDKDCSGLPFHEMRVIERNGPFEVVRCEVWERIDDTTDT